MHPSILVSDPHLLPLPAPGWLLELLLHSTFFLHLVAMNLLLGGAVIAVIERHRGEDLSLRLAARIDRLLPVALAFTATLGVGVLLFLQALYGHVFDPIRAITAWPAWLVIPALLGISSLAYAVAFRTGWPGGAGVLLRAIVALGLLGVAFVYVNHATLTLRPGIGPSPPPDGPGAFPGNLDDSTLLPRFVHLVVGALSVAGLIVALLGTRRLDRDPPEGRYMVRTGGMWFLFTTGAQFGPGFWLLLSLPRETMMAFMGEDLGATILLMASILLGMAAMLVMAIGVGRPRPVPWVRAAAVLTAPTLMGMILTRDVVRDLLLPPSARPEKLEVRSPEAVLVLLGALFALGLSTVTWMVREYRRAGNARPRA